MATDHARQDLQTNGVGVRDVRPRDGRENTIPLFSGTPDGNTGRENPHDGHDDGNPRYGKMGAEHEHPGIFGAAP